MAGSTSTQLEVAFGITTANWDGITAFFKQNDIVYRKEQYLAGQQKIQQKPYVVDSVMDLQSAANGDILDANGDVADGSQAANYSITGTGSQSNAQWPTFYRVHNYYKPSETAIVHESTLKNLAGVKALVDLVDDTWVDPS